MKTHSIPPKMHISLKMAREAKGLTQEEAARLIGVKPDTLGNYERGKTYPNVPILRNIEKVYGVPYSNIIFLPLDFGLTEQSEA